MTYKGKAIQSSVSGSRPAASRQRHVQRGGTMAGFLVGVVTGLVIALVVAMLVTNTPLPFNPSLISKRQDASMDSKANAAIAKAAGSAMPAAMSDGVPDPNRSIYSRDVKEGRLQVEDAVKVISTSEPDERVRSNNSASLEGYFLQAGSFRNQEDAEQLRARLALTGVEANVLQAEVNGKAVNRVRIGPFPSIEEAYRTRARLTDNGFEARLVRPPAAVNAEAGREQAGGE